MRSCQAERFRLVIYRISRLNYKITYKALAKFLQPTSLRLSETDGQDEYDEDEDLVEVHDLR